MASLLRGHFFVSQGGVTRAVCRMHGIPSWRDINIFISTLLVGLTATLSVAQQESPIDLAQQLWVFVSDDGFENELREHYEKWANNFVQSAFSSGPFKDDIVVKRMLLEEIEFVLDTELSDKMGLKLANYQAFAEVFSDAELRELLVFAKLPVGKKTLLNLTEITRQSRINRVRWGRSLETKIKAKFSARITEYAARTLDSAEQ